MQQRSTEQVSESEVVRVSVGQRIEQGNHSRIFATAKVAF